MTKKIESRIDNHVREKLGGSGNPFLQEKNDLSAELQRALASSSKSGSGAGYPDFALEYPDHPGLVVVIEDKYLFSKLAHRTKKGVLTSTAKAVNDYAVNGAFHYARNILEDDHFREVIAVGCAGETTEVGLEVEVEVYFFFSADHEPKRIEVGEELLWDKLHPENFSGFYRDISLTDEERAAALHSSYQSLQKTAKDLNRIFYDYSIPVDHRVIIVSGMLLAMEDLKPSELKGNPETSNSRDGARIVNAIQTVLDLKQVPDDKQRLMMSTFDTIQADPERDRPRTVIGSGKRRGQKTNCTINKEIFTFIYDNVYRTISQNHHLDALGEMYSIFLKYALGDGKENGIVLTPPYVTDMMCELAGVDSDSVVLDPCTGSAGFLVAAMSRMVQDAQGKYHGDELVERVRRIKGEQLLGCELDLKMFSLAATNMILRGDGSSRIIKGSFFDNAGNLPSVPTVAILNPPFSYSENGMPFCYESLEQVARGGIVALIIQDSAGTGKAVTTNRKILKNHTLLASIRMPVDLFMPSAGVQTSIYVFEAGKPHHEKQLVKFIDLSVDGYKRTSRGTTENAGFSPKVRYRDVVEIFRYGSAADNTTGVEFVEDTIAVSGDGVGADWNYTQHQVFDTIPTEQDFMDTVGEYMSFELQMILSGRGHLIGLSDEVLEEARVIMEQHDADLDALMGGGSYA